jgi:DNA-directed RNA polymerase specialized sigma subunit
MSASLENIIVTHYAKIKAIIKPFSDHLAMSIDDLFQIAMIAVLKAKPETEEWTEELAGAIQTELEIFYTAQRPKKES